MRKLCNFAIYRKKTWLNVRGAVFEDTALSRSVRTVTVAEGRPVVLRCSHYVSVPRATVTWYSVKTTSRDHWSIVDQTPVDSDDRIAVDDRGMSVCSGFNVTRPISAHS